jgi:hypothetical protein
VTNCALSTETLCPDGPLTATWGVSQELVAVVVDVVGVAAAAVVVVARLVAGIWRALVVPPDPPPPHALEVIAVTMSAVVKARVRTCT